MPFTFAHPIFAAPLKWVKPTYISLTGLVLGAMSPDFEYFIALEPHQWIGHSMKGLLLEAIPLSIILAFLFHKIIKQPLAYHLPSYYGLDQRAVNLVEEHRWLLYSLRQWTVFLVSVIIGFYSHLLVDAFTHESGTFVQNLPWLQGSLIGALPNYKLLQYSSSLAGMAIEATILLFIMGQVKPSSRWKRSLSARHKLRYWGIAIIVMLVVWGLKLLLMSSNNWLGASVVAPISGLFAGIVVASFLNRNTLHSS